MTADTRYIVTENSRFRMKRSTEPSEVPTIPTEDGLSEDWLPTDIMVGEWFLNTADGRLWTRGDNGLLEVDLNGSNEPYDLMLQLCPDEDELQDGQRFTFFIPRAMKIEEVYATCSRNVATSANTFDIRIDDVSIIDTSNKITIEADELTSFTSPTQPVLLDDFILENQKVQILSDDYASGLNGVRVYLKGHTNPNF